MSEKKSTSKINKNQNDKLDEKVFNSRLQACPIAIVGMASIFADAKNLDQYWDNISNAVDAITDVPESNWKIDDYYSADKNAADKTYCKRGGFLPEIDFDPMEFGLPPNILELTDITQLLSLVVARDVLNDAGLGDDSGYDRDKIGITLGVGGGQKQIGPLHSRLQGPVLKKVLASSGVNDADSEIIIEKFKKAYIGWEENSFPGMLGNVISGRIANRFDLGGTNCVVDAACASSLAAIKLAISDLLEHRSEVMLSGGICCDNSPFMYMSFSKTPAFTSGEDIRPFDDDSKGMMIGEGIGMMAFKRLEDAERDGDRIYAVLKGIGTSSDGRFKSIYAPRPDGQAKALQRAYNDAGWDPKTCGLIEAHGTGTKAGDAAEFEGLRKHFSQDNEQTQHIALGSVKSQIGHAKAAAGAAGMIKAILALHHKVLPPTLHIDKPNTNLDIENSPLYLNSERRPWMPRKDGAPRRAGVSSFGFGGTNYHMVLEEYQPNAHGQFRINHVPQSILFIGKDEHAIKKQLQDWQIKLNLDADSQPFAFNALVCENKIKTPDIEQARCAFNAKDAGEALALIAVALKQFDNNAGMSDWSHPKGIYYRQSGIQTSGKVVALFSGQGSQYVNMGNELLCNFPSMMQSAAQMDKEFANNDLSHLSSITYPIPVFTQTDIDKQNDKLRLTQYAQPAIGALSMGLFNTFKSAGFKADFTGGHSFGELTALWAAEVINTDDYIMLARSRGQAMAAPESNDFDAGTMIAVVGDSGKIAKEIETIADVSIANYNSNNQVVIAGSTAQIAITSDLLITKNYKVIPLPVSAAFHTPLVGHAKAPFATAIDKVKFSTPNMPVYSNGTGTEHSSNAIDIKQALKNHILSSVHFKTEIDNLYAAGGRIFVEFGPKNILTKLTENILADKSDIATIAINANPGKSADLQLRQAALQLSVLGLTLSDIDPHSAVKRPLKPVKKSPLTMKLTGAAFVSDKTQKQFDDALNDGWKISQAPTTEPKVVEKIVEKIVEVEKIVYVDRPVKDAQEGVEQADLISSIERSVSKFVDHQKHVLDVHEQYMQAPKEYAQTVQTVLNQHSDAQLPKSVENTLDMYHDFQSETLRVHEQYLNNQSQNMTELLNNSEQPAELKLSPDLSQQIQSTNGPLKKTIQSADDKSETVSAQPAALPVQTTATALAPVIELPQQDFNTINQVMLDVVADKTGYPIEMLELSMDMEADLGIDSIKRVEILGAVQDELTDLPELNPEDLTQLRTLGEIVDFLKSQSKQVSHKAQTPELHLVAKQQDTTNAISLEHIQTVMMSVVADKTGYPVEMLELEMDMEADLGIDSIKRVEILGAVQDEITDLPDLNPEELTQLRTLGEIVAYMQAQTPDPESAVSSKPQLVTNPEEIQSNITLVDIQTVMMSVVADKTGYPVEMLELEMDMEADLGIDSIKRVEILGAVQDEITDLPDLNPEELAQLRTLGEIVAYMQAQTPSSESAVSSKPQVVTNPEEIQTNITLVDIQTVMMSVVADKTGYPVEMLELEMDMEADLGIDSIKRVEILGAVQDEITDLPDLNPEELAQLRTLGEIVAYMQAQTPSSAVDLAENPQDIKASEVKTAGVTLDQINTVMMSVVADKTGYPVEMLELEMDMEADLGIDSIKRVEILGAVQDEITDLPDLNPEELAQLRTLGEIVIHMQSKSIASDSSYVLNDNFTDLKVSKEELVTRDNNVPSATVVIEKLGSIYQISQEISGAHALIVDDGTKSAISLATQLTAQGWQVSVLKPDWLTKSTNTEYEKVVNVVAINDVNESQITEFITGHNQLDAVIYMHQVIKIDNIQYPEQSKKSLQLAFLLAKLCNVQSANNTRGAFIAITRQSGCMSVEDNKLTSNSTSDLIQGGVNGLVKTLSHEWPSVLCRAIDFPANLEETYMASLIMQELLDVETSLNEVAYNIDENGNAQRLTLAARQTNSNLLERGNSITTESVFLVSGGAKGVTAHCVLELAKQLQCKFILLGRSVYEADEPHWAQGITEQAALKKAVMQDLMVNGDKPTPAKISELIKPVLANREIKKTLEAIQTAGGQAYYISADVTDSKSVQKAVKPAIAELGNITGIIHGAGVLADNFIEKKTLSDFDAVYRTKIDGLHALLSVVLPNKLKHLALFSSAAGFYGNPGQSDYAIANEILNKTAHRFKLLHPNVQVISFNWGPWDGGMVTPQLKRMFNERGVFIIPLDGGAQLFVNELAAIDNQSVQVLVGNDLSKQHSTEKDNTVKKSQVSRLIKTIKTTNMPFLSDHMIAGNKVLPTVCAIAWMCEAVNKFYPDYHVKGIEDYRLFKGIVFDGTAPEEINFEISLLEQNRDTVQYGVKVSSELTPDKVIYHYSANVILMRSAPISDERASLSLPAQLESVIDAQDLYQDGTLFHGESFQGITKVIDCDQAGLLIACMVNHSAHNKQGQFPVPSANNRLPNIFANDLVYQAMLVWVKRSCNFGSLPVKTKEWIINREVVIYEPFFIKLSVVEKTATKLIADVMIISHTKEILAEVKSAEVTISEQLTHLFLTQSTEQAVI